MHAQIAISEIAEITLHQMKVFCLKVESRSPAFKSSSGVLSLSPGLRETQNAKQTKKNLVCIFLQETLRNFTNP